MSITDDKAAEEIQEIVKRLKLRVLLKIAAQLILLALRWDASAANRAIELLAVVRELVSVVVFKSLVYQNLFGRLVSQSSRGDGQEEKECGCSE